MKKTITSTIVTLTVMSLITINSQDIYLEDEIISSSIMARKSNTTDACLDDNTDIQIAVAEFNKLTSPICSGPADDVVVIDNTDINESDTSDQDIEIAEISNKRTLYFDAKPTRSMESALEGGGRLKYINLKDVTVTSGLTAEIINNASKDTNMADLGDAFIDAEKVYGVNAAFLWALAVQESGWGNSNIAKTKNNLFGFRAYDKSPGKSAKPFKTKEDSIMYVAGYLSYKYLEEDGRYYSGKSIDDIHKWKDGKHKYSSSDDWRDKIVKIIKRLER